MLLFQILLNCFTLLSMFSTAWCTEPLLQGLGLSLATKTAGSLTAGQCCGSRDRLPWLLPLTLSTLLKRDSFVQITGKVNYGYWISNEVVTVSCKVNRFPSQSFI